MAILSKREEDMVQDLLKGLASKEIADRNCISTHTVNTHFKSIKVKLNAKNNVEVAVKYLAAMDNVGAYLKSLAVALLFFGIQGGIICSGYDDDLRRPTRRINRTTRIVKKK